MVFSPTITGSELSDKIYSFGEFDNEDSRDVVNFTQEVLGLYFIVNPSPDYEGISFYLEDGTFERIGLDQAYTPDPAHFTILPARLIGF